MGGKLPAQSQVPELQHPTRTDQHICWLYVPVQYASSMQGLKGTHNLPQRNTCASVCCQSHISGWTENRPQVLCHCSCIKTTMSPHGAHCGF